MTDLRPSDLTAEERAVFHQVAIGAWLGQPGAVNGESIDSSFEAAMRYIEFSRALFAPAKEEAIPQEWGCERCRKALGANETHRDATTGDFSCWPKEPTPPSEMPEALRVALAALRANHRDGKCDKADALESWWRSHPAPAAVRMTEELERVLGAAELRAQELESRGPAWHKYASDERRDIAAVRAQAERAAIGKDGFTPAFHAKVARQLRMLRNADHFDAATIIEQLLVAVRTASEQAQKVELTKVRLALTTMKAHFEPSCQGDCEFPAVWGFCKAALAELNAAEGKVTG